MVTLILSMFLMLQQAQPYTITAYCLTGRMANGSFVHHGAIAVDPSVIPLGTTVYIEDLGYYVAEDTGGGVIGNHIDVYMASCDDAIEWGRRTRLVTRVD